MDCEHQGQSLPCANGEGDTGLHVNVNCRRGQARVMRAEVKGLWALGASGKDSELHCTSKEDMRPESTLFCSIDSEILLYSMLP